MLALLHALLHILGLVALVGAGILVALLVVVIVLLLVLLAGGGNPFQ